MYVHGRDRNFRPLIVIRPRIITEMGIVNSILFHTYPVDRPA